MKFKINQDHFSNGLQQVLNVVATRSTMPILSNVLIEAGDGQIELTTTNLDLGIRCRIKADVETPEALPYACSQVGNDCTRAAAERSLC